MGPGGQFRVPCGGWDLQQHFLLWSEEQLPVQPCNNSYFFNIPSNIPSKQTPPGSDLQCSALISPVHARAGWDTDRAPAGSSTAHGGVKLLLEGALSTPAAFRWQIQHQTQGQGHNGTFIYILTRGSQARRAVKAGRGKSCSRMTWRC